MHTYIIASVLLKLFWKVQKLDTSVDLTLALPTDGLPLAVERR